MWRHTNRLVASVLVAGFILCGLFGVFSGLGMEKPTQVAFVILLVGATLWITEAVPLFVTSLIILFLSKVWLMGLIREIRPESTETLFLAPFFSNIILLFLGGFVISAALHKYQIDEDIARRILAKTGHSIPLMIAGVMCITAFFSMWLSNTATTAMMLALCIPIAARLPSTDRYRKAIILSIPLAANVGGLGTPIGSPPNAIAMQYMHEAGMAPSFGKWIVLGLPGVSGMLILIWFLLMIAYRGASTRISLDIEPHPSVYSRRAIIVIGVAFLTAVGWMTGPLHGVSSGTVALVPVLFFFGARFLSTKDLRGLSWDVLLVMGGGLCLGSVISAGGLADWLIDRVPTEGMNPFILALAFGIIACVMSSVMSNTATANLIMPIIIGVGAERMSPMLVGAAFSCSLAMALPVSTPPNAMAFSTDELAVKDILRPGLIATIAGLGLTFTAGWWWWEIIGLR